MYTVLTESVRLIGSVAVTVPAATWLWSQGPKKSDHGHGDEAHAEEHHEEEPQQESEDKAEETKDEGSDESGEGGRSETSEQE